MSQSWRYNISVSGLWFCDFMTCEHPRHASGLRIYQEENNGSDLQKKQAVRWQTWPVSVFKLRHCGLEKFFWNVSDSSRSWRLNVSSCLGLEILGNWNVSVSSQSWVFNISVSSQSWEFEKWNVSSRSWRLTVSVLWLKVLWTSLVVVLAMVVLAVIYSSHLRKHYVM